jgi:hypothetical protein
MHSFLKFIIEIKLYVFRTVPLSIIRSYSLYTKQWYMSYRFADSLNPIPPYFYSISLTNACCCMYSLPYRHPVPLSRNLGALTSCNPLGHSRPVTGLLYLFYVKS